MQRELVVKTKSLAGSSDLTLIARIRPGLVPSLESVSYKTRLKRLLQTLNGGRASSHEFALVRGISDSVERVGKIHSVRVVIFEPPEDVECTDETERDSKVMLAVTFEGNWESYIRVLWQKVGTLLDVIFCNSVDYVSAFDHTFEEWLAWARRVQVETGFFYATPNLTVDDVQYLRGSEFLYRSNAGDPGRDLAATRHRVSSAEAQAHEAATASLPARLEFGKLAVQSLAVLYRLTDLYLPGSADGKYLQRAARELLLEFVRSVTPGTDFFTGAAMPTDQQLLDGLKNLDAAARQRFARQLAWLSYEEPRPVAQRQPLGQPEYDAHDVQGGILHAYENVTHGCLLLMAVDTPAAAAALIGDLLPRTTRDSGERMLADGKIAMNVAFTYQGLRAAGLSERQLEYFPQEFREGMDARAATLGDVRSNHPRRWRLPTRYGAIGAAGAQIELSTIHVCVQLRTASCSDVFEDVTNPAHPLHAEIERLNCLCAGARVLAVQPMRRHYRSDPADAGRTPKVTEHFGFSDGHGQPEIEPPVAMPMHYKENQVHLGELLLGHANRSDAAPTAATAGERMQWLRNGSFLVVRKLRQDVEALERAVGSAARTNAVPREEILQRMMGRTLEGAPLVTPSVGLNDFTYASDPTGAQCPFHAHVRRANPRVLDDPRNPTQPGGRIPRIMRRGMSYGPRYNRDDAADPANGAERGMVFMAYNASIAEQFEVVQRWISGGNSTGGFSGQSDPFMGVPENGRKRTFRFEHPGTGDGKAVTVELDGSTSLLGDPRPFVRLEWGAYLFTPSLSALARLRDVATGATVRPTPLWSAEEGRAHIQALRASNDTIEGWKTLLEDPDARDKYVTASVWAAIREYHGGVLRTPYGVLVGDRARVMEVLTDKQGQYSVRGYRERMARSIGEIYLGLDHSRPGGQYELESRAANEAIAAIPEDEAFALTRKLTQAVLTTYITNTKDLARGVRGKRWELNLDFREVSDEVLGRLCEHWFGVSEEGGHLKRGSGRWDWDEKSAPLYPGNLTAPSRYIFQARPGAEAEAYGCTYGRTLTDAVHSYVESSQGRARLSAAPVSKKILAAFNSPALSHQVARTLVGALMGMVPTVDGNLRLSLNEWLRDGTFWSLRAALQESTLASYADAKRLLGKPLLQAMQLRPSPELIWRTARRAHALGGTEVVQDDVIVVSLVSATQQCLEHGIPDAYPVFGGDRSAAVHPTHACPGYRMAMGILMGVFTAFLEVKEVMRPSPAALAFTFEGDV